MNLPAKHQINAALADKMWNLLNQVLYEYCRKEPGHRRADVILTKTMLLGRVYAVALEHSNKGQGMTMRGFSGSMYMKRPRE